MIKIKKNTNRRRHRLENKLPFSDASPWFLLLALVMLGGVMWVHYTIQLVQRGETIRDMEKQLVEMGRKNEALRGRIARLSTITALQERCRELAKDETLTPLVKISPENIVQSRLPVRNVADLEMDSEPVAAR